MHSGGNKETFPYTAIKSVIFKQLYYVLCSRGGANFSDPPCISSKTADSSGFLMEFVEDWKCDCN